MLFNRTLAPKLEAMMTYYPVVTVTGPRQSGKTTLVRHQYPNMPYYNLEAPDTRASIEADPRQFFENHAEGAILDEIQRAPELLSYLQVIVDETKKPGQFILTGSHQLSLHQAITQSLAGRTAILELLPLSLEELKQSHILLTADEYMLRGFFPAVYEPGLPPTVAYRNYIKTCLERDIRQLINLKDLTQFQRFIALSAGRISHMLNLEGMSNELGVAHNTVKHWFSILEASYLVFRLQPYYENFGKRIIKSPKLYFCDVGLVSHLLGIEDRTLMSLHRMRGELFENMVVIELFKLYFNRALEPKIFYYRDNHQNEVDIVLAHKGYLIPIEIKSTATFNTSLLKNLKFYHKLVGDRAPVSFLIYNGEIEEKIETTYVLNFRSLPKLLDMLPES